MKENLTWRDGAEPTTRTDTGSQPSSGQEDTGLLWLYGGQTPPPAPVPPARPAEKPAPRIPQMPAPAGAPEPAGTPAPARATPAKPPRRARRVVLAVLGVLLAWVAFLVYTPLHAWNSVARVNDVPTGARPPQQPGTAILLVGSDSRDDLTPEQQAQLGTGGGGIGSRTDVMMIYYIPPKGAPALISLPRDSYLPIPGHGKNKLNAAAAFGGPSLLVQTVEQATGIRLDGYLEIGFGGFVGLVDLVGGVSVCLDKPMVDQDANINLPAGCQTLDGANALGYVRQRHQDPQGDLGRVQRQREIMTKVLAKLATPSTVINPVRYWRTNRALAGMLTKGQDTGLGVMKNAMIGALAAAKGSAISLTVPVANANATTPAGSSVLWDDNQAKAMFALIAKGDTSTLKLYVK